MVMKRKPIRLRQRVHLSSSDGGGYGGHVVLSQEDRMKFATFLLLLVQVDKRNNRQRTKTRRNPIRTMLAKQNQRSFARLMNEVKRVNMPVGSNVFGVLREKIKMRALKGF